MPRAGTYIPDIIAKLSPTSTHDPLPHPLPLPHQEDRVPTLFSLSTHNPLLTHGDQLVVEINALRQVLLDGSHVHAAAEAHHQDQARQLRGKREARRGWWSRGPAVAYSHFHDPCGTWEPITKRIACSPRPTYFAYLGKTRRDQDTVQLEVMDVEQRPQLPELLLTFLGIGLQGVGGIIQVHPWIEWVRRTASVRMRALHLLRPAQGHSGDKVCYIRLADPPKKKVHPTAPLVPCSVTPHA